VKQLEIRARILAERLFAGSYRSVFRGWGLDFEEVREYESGDDIRSIDWNVTARMGSPYVKKFREERELNVILAVDVSASSWFGTAGMSKRELAAEVAALLAVAATSNNDRVALLLFSDAVDDFMAPDKGRPHLLRVITRLLSAESRRAATDMAVAGRFVQNVSKKRSVVLVLSDFFAVNFEAPLRALAQRHDVIALVLNDPRERELPSVGIVALEDAETGQVRYVDTASPELRAAYAEMAERRGEERRAAFARTGIDSVDLHTDGAYVPALLALFSARMRRH
jgi:uncharacterized protein (DUF58 family)